MISWLYLIFWVVVVGAAIGFRLTKNNNNHKAAQSGEDKVRLRKALESLLGQGGKFLYARWEDRETYGRTVRTTFYRYGVVYQGQTLYVAPLHIDKKTHEIQAAQPMVFTPENLGKVTVNTKEKDGMVTYMEVRLFDKQGKPLLQLIVEAECLRKSKWYPVNIAQQEECQAFESFIASLEQRVTSENPGVDALMAANDNTGLGYFGAMVSVFGIVLAFFFPPVGIFLSLVGLCMSIVSKVKGSKSKVPLIISVVSILWSSVLVWVYITV